jgi:hypothetical protein
MNSTWQAVRVGAGETGIDVLNEVAKHGVVVVTGGNTVRPLSFPLYLTRSLTVPGCWARRMDARWRPWVSQQYLWYGR